MTVESGGDSVLELLREGYREEMITLLKYRKLAQSLDRLYGSKELLSILQDEELHARLFVELTRELRYDIGDVGEQALIQELNDMAEAELKIAKLYEEAVNQNKIRNERIVAALHMMTSDSKRHHRMLTHLSSALKSRSAERFSSPIRSEIHTEIEGKNGV